MCQVYRFTLPSAECPADSHSPCFAAPHGRLMCRTLKHAPLPSHARVVEPLALSPRDMSSSVSTTNNELYTNRCTMHKVGLTPSPPSLPPSLLLPSPLQYHNDELYANMYTMHSWSGIVVVTLFYANYVGGFCSFFAGITPQWVRRVSLSLALLHVHAKLTNFVCTTCQTFAYVADFLFRCVLIVRR